MRGLSHHGVGLKQGGGQSKEGALGRNCALTISNINFVLLSTNHTSHVRYRGISYQDKRDRAIQCRPHTYMYTYSTIETNLSKHMLLNGPQPEVN